MDDECGSGRVEQNEKNMKKNDQDEIDGMKQEVYAKDREGAMHTGMSDL